MNLKELAEQFIDKQEPIGDTNAPDYWQMKAWEKGVRDFANYLIEQSKGL